MNANHERSVDGRRLAVVWAKEHWQLAVFICACTPWIGVILVELDWLSVRAACVAVPVSVGYVLVLTWGFTHDRQKVNEEGRVAGRIGHDDGHDDGA